MKKYIILTHGTTGNPIPATVDVESGVSLIQGIGILSKTLRGAWEIHAERCKNKSIDLQNQIEELQNKAKREKALLEKNSRLWTERAKKVLEIVSDLKDGD